MSRSHAEEMHHSLIDAVATLSLMEIYTPNDEDEVEFLTRQFADFQQALRRASVIWDLVAEHFAVSDCHVTGLGMCSKTERILVKIFDKRCMYEPDDFYERVSNGECFGEFMDWVREMRNQLSDAKLRVCKLQLICDLRTEFALASFPEEFSHAMSKDEAGKRFGISWDALKERIKKGLVRAKEVNHKAVKIHLDDLPKPHQLQSKANSIDKASKI